MSTAIKKRVTVLEEQTGVRDMDRAKLTVLDPDDRDFYLALKRRERASGKDFDRC